ncbi:bifunctional UDP-N-acetylglucosamine diphosphorylase/glucosamine-1-phosphate N-acetyltransferase GlmU [Halioxenophilus aromaticivorans]|uniref:Bifunctional protein GlmU n=1 Tax=Halioxenophilus aromaticivorans TaxID=1306992 RepID=A0AAV3U8C5_9ALTE
MIDIIILAAGKGSRMKSQLPKVMQKLAGSTLIEHVLNTALKISGANIHVVLGHQSAKVSEVLEHYPVNRVYQEVQLGTGDAVACALPALQKYGISLVLYGDVPLISLTTIRDLVELVDENSLALLTTELEDPNGYGRIVRDKHDRVTAIVEQKDASDSQLAIGEINTGILAVRNEDLERWLPKLSNHNAQGEFYLTDIIAMAVADGREVRTTDPTQLFEILGVNDRIQQAQLERVFQEQYAHQLMLEGVTLLDPTRLDVRGNLVCEADVSIDVNCIFEGEVRIGNNVTIEGHCHIKNAIINDGCHIKAFTHIENAIIDSDCVVGPYARLRPGTQLFKNAKIGNFVETKNAVIGEGSKVNHLSYVGDAELGSDVNVGAGTITCNYDGVNKHKTVIGDNAFIGSNTALVAPVEVGKNATIGAGSTIGRSVPENSLAVTRAKQMHKADWPRPKKKDK